MPEVPTRHGTVSYADTGSGPAVVLLHATLHDHRDFAPIAGAIAREYRTVAVDWPGHGASERGGAPVSAMDLADTLEDFVGEVGLGHSVFVGSSVGGFAAARLAIRDPEAVAGLVLVNAGGFTAPTRTTRSFCRMMGHPLVSRRVLPLLVSRYVRARTDDDRAVSARVRAEARTREGSRVAAELWRSFADPAYDLRAEAHRITAPTMLVWGTEDVVLPARAGRETHAAIPGSTLHEIASGHLPFSSEPEQFLDAVMPFLASVTAGGRV